MVESFASLHADPAGVSGDSERLRVVWIGMELPKQLCIQPSMVEMLAGLDRTNRYPGGMRSMIRYLQSPRRVSDADRWFASQGLPSKFKAALVERGDILVYSSESNGLHEFDDIMFLPSGRMWDGNGLPVDDPTNRPMRLRGFVQDTSLMIDPMMQQFLFVNRDIEDIPTRAKVVAEILGVAQGAVRGRFLRTFGDLLEVNAACLLHRD